MNLQSIGEIVSILAQITTAAWILCCCLWLRNLSSRIRDLEDMSNTDRDLLKVFKDIQRETEIQRKNGIDKIDAIKAYYDSEIERLKKQYDK